MERHINSRTTQLKTTYYFFSILKPVKTLHFFFFSFFLLIFLSSSCISSSSSSSSTFHSISLCTRLWFTWSTRCKPCWLQTHGHLPSSAFLSAGLKACVTIPSSHLLLNLRNLGDNLALMGTIVKVCKIGRILKRAP